jgi:polyisoprenyl-phosphate glycosyltransferase
MSGSEAPASVREVELTAVVPVFNEEAVLPELHRRLVDAFGQTGVASYEVILVNDGSQDRSAEIIRRICETDPRFRALHFSRNFGHQAGVAAGLRYSRGRAVVVMDADLQDPPELVAEMMSKWREGYDVVYAQRTGRRREGILKRGLAYLYYRTLRKLVNIDIPPDAGDFCLMDRRVVEQLNYLTERTRYMRGLRAWVGFRQTSVAFDRPVRHAGEVKYTLRKSLRLAVNGIISLSEVPLRLATYFGLLVSAASFVLGLVFIGEKLFIGVETRGWASTIVVILFLGGVQLLTIGIIGEYLSRIYDEVKQRPLFIVQAMDGFSDDTKSNRPLSSHPRRSAISSTE